jgi:formate dehydrogenase subunit beta
MSKALRINDSLDKGVHSFLAHLLQKEKVKGIFTLVKTNKEGAAAYMLVTRPEQLDDAVPLHPLMPVNAGGVLSSFTLDSDIQEPVAAVLRPCEMRAFIELVKRDQGSLENFLLISCTCPGVFPLKSLSDGKLKKNRASYWDSAKKADIFSDIRLTCRSCLDFIPESADIVVGTLGMKNADKECILYLNTPKGNEFAANGPGSVVAANPDTEDIKNLKIKKTEEKKKLEEDFQKKRQGHKAIVQTFAACLGCHACGEVCPICYCELCHFDSRTSEYYPGNVRSDLDRKGGLKVPPGNLFYHLGRMSHMAVSCVSCGMCSDVCPVNIPVASVFSLVGDALQEVFEYYPGGNLEDEVPSGTYKEQEFEEIGER